MLQLSASRILTSKTHPARTLVVFSHKVKSCTFPLWYFCSGRFRFWKHLPSLPSLSVQVCPVPLRTGTDQVQPPLLGMVWLLLKWYLSFSMVCLALIAQSLIFFFSAWVLIPLVDCKQKKLSFFNLYIVLNLSST